MFRLSVSQFCSYRWSLFQDVVRYAQQGVPAIGLWRRKLDDFGHDNAIDLISEMNMAVSSLSWAGGFTGSEGDSFTATLDDAIEAIVLAHRLQAQCLIVHPGSRNGHTNSHLARLFRNAMQALVPIAEDYGVRLAVEPCLGFRKNTFNFFDSLPNQLQAIQEFSPEQVGLVLDLYHMGETDQPESLLAKIQQRIALVQMADYQTRMATTESRCPLGEGQVPIEKWLKCLSEIDYQGFVELELHGLNFQNRRYDNTIRQSQSFLSSLMVEPQWDPTR